MSELWKACWWMVITATHRLSPLSSFGWQACQQPELNRIRPRPVLSVGVWEGVVFIEQLVYSGHLLLFLSPYNLSCPHMFFFLFIPPSTFSSSPPPPLSLFLSLPLLAQESNNEIMLLLEKWFVDFAARPWVLGGAPQGYLWTMVLSDWLRGFRIISGPRGHTCFPVSAETQLLLSILEWVEHPTLDGLLVWTSLGPDQFCHQLPHGLPYSRIFQQMI